MNQNKYIHKPMMKYQTTYAKKTVNWNLKYHN